MTLPDSIHAANICPLLSTCAQTASAINKISNRTIGKKFSARGSFES